MQKKSRMFLFALVVLSASLSGCCHSSEDDDLRTVSITNNPNLIPSDGEGPVMAMPY